MAVGTKRMKKILKKTLNRFIDEIPLLSGAM